MKAWNKIKIILLIFFSIIVIRVANSNNVKDTTDIYSLDTIVDKEKIKVKIADLEVLKIDNDDERLDIAYDNYVNQLAKLEDFENDASYTTPFSNLGQTADFLSLGINQLVESYFYVDPLLSKIEKGEELTLEETILFESLVYKNDINSLDLRMESSYEMCESLWK